MQQLRKVDAHGSVLGGAIQFNLDASRITPQLIALTDPGAHFDTVIVGECPMLSGSICLVFTKDNTLSLVREHLYLCIYLFIYYYYYYCREVGSRNANRLYTA